ncbi:MAG: SWIM zinc finger family protein [Bryobacterales bacterium]|nr:SWIM zinc finger family protein [Bryobacterales bacterium]
MAGYRKTWWGDEFIGALETCMDKGRLSRGRAYSSPFRLRTFKIRTGAITAKMRGNKNAYFGVYKTPYYDVQVRFKRVPKPIWAGILEQIGANANWVTHLILGEVPPTIEDAFTGTVGLLPSRPKDFSSKCSCPDWASPCKHVAGAYYHLASLLDEDPLLLFTLRGLSQSDLMEAIVRSEFGAALAGQDPSPPELAVWAQEGRFPAVETEGSLGDPANVRSFWRGLALPTDAGIKRGDPPVSALPVRRAGDYPEFWHHHRSFVDAMAEFYEKVSKGLPQPPPPGFPGQARR